MNDHKDETPLELSTGAQIAVILMLTGSAAAIVVGILALTGAIS